MCAYKPPRTSNETLRGLAQVLLNPKKPTVVRVKLTKKGQDGQDETTQYDIDKAQCPAYIKSGLWRVNLSQRGDKMFSAIPADASLTCKFAGISHKEGEVPTPKLVSGGQYGDYLQFIANFKVVEGEFAGLEIPMFLRYNFEPVQDGSHTVVGYSHYSEKRPSKYSIMLDKTLEAIGVWEKGPIAWKDNILPVIVKRAMVQAEEQDRKVILTLTDGYVASIKPALSDAWDDEDADEKVEPVPANVPVSEPDPDAEEETAPAAAEKETTDEIDWDAE